MIQKNGSFFHDQPPPGGSRSIWSRLSFLVVQGWLISPGGVGRRAWFCAPAGCAGRRSSAWVCHRVVPGECDFLPGGIRSQPAGVGSSSRRQRSGGIGVASSQSGESFKSPCGSIFHLTSAEFFGRTGSAYGPRQIIQLTNTRSGKEWIGPALRDELAKLKGPLHFIDFETSTMALPYHRGMRPFELVAFQWSCHTMTSPGTQPAHREWINFEQAYPNVEFARTLRAAVGDAGTLLTWSNHERTTMRTIAEKIEAYFPEELELASWLRHVVDGSRIMDMCALAREGYFHPEMKGSLSIKYVLPAIWRHNSALRDVPWFRSAAFCRQ